MPVTVRVDRPGYVLNRILPSTLIKSKKNRFGKVLMVQKLPILVITMVYALISSPSLSFGSISPLRYELPHVECQYRTATAT